MATQLQQFFKTCDPEGNRSVDMEAFRELCSRLNIGAEDADVIFEDLDHDKDGRISFTDFSRGFSNFLSNNTLEEMTSEEQTLEMDEVGKNNSDETTKQDVWTTLTSEIENLDRNKSSDESKLKWLLKELQMSEQRHLVPYLESAVEELLANMHQLQEEKVRLEETWLREKQEHGKHLKRMEEEMDHQVKEAELKMRLKAQEEVEDERKVLQSRMDGELEKLQSHLKLVERVYAWLRSQPGEGEGGGRLNEVHSKLDEAVRDNRQLRMSLLDTQTSIALMRTELLQLRTLYDEKCRELSSERERIMEVLQEQDHLSRQLNLMHDANKRLLDSHDVLRSTIESPVKQAPPVMKRCKSGSIIGDYLDTGCSHDILDRFQEDDEDDDSSESRRLHSLDSMCVVRRRTKTKDRQQGERQSLNHSDSGVSTVRDSGEDQWRGYSPRDLPDSEEEAGLEGRGRTRGRNDSGQSRDSRPTSMPPPAAEKFQLCEYGRRGEYSDMKIGNSQDSLLGLDTLPRRRISDIKKQLGIEDTPTNWNKSPPSGPLKCSTPKDLTLNGHHRGIPPTPMPRTSKINAIYESIDMDEGSEAGELNNNSVEVEGMYEPTGPAEQTFKVIFVGDAGVGKSSFALRISKGVFVRHMSSTLGLDFLMRTLRVDGKNVAVQLWDTAGQERFRSITKTYFRKADGVMLLYDCTCEHSFLNVRQWVDDIDKASSQRIPLMIIANKIDLREISKRSGTDCISKEQGEKLAKTCDTTFMEASAKDGSNVLHSLAKLIRSMNTHQDLQMSASTMQLSNSPSKKSYCCGK